MESNLGRIGISHHGILCLMPTDTVSTTSGTFLKLLRSGGLGESAARYIRYIELGGLVESLKGESAKIGTERSDLSKLEDSRNETGKLEIFRGSGG